MPFRPPRSRALMVGVTGLATSAALAATGLPVDPEPQPAPDTDTAAVVAPAMTPLAERIEQDGAIAAALHGEVETAPEPTEAQSAAESVEPAPEPEPAQPARTVWDDLADCEAGEWTADGGFVEGSANWSATAGLFEGGLQFHPGTWDGFRDADMPAAAYDATRAQQIQVAERVLDAQGWKAWPVCSRKLGLR